MQGAAVVHQRPVIQRMAPWANLSLPLEWHLDRFSSFCSAPDRDHTQTTGSQDMCTNSMSGTVTQAETEHKIAFVYL